MQFKTKPDDGTAVPLIRRIDREEQPDVTSTPPPVFVRRERGESRIVAREQKERRPGTAVFRAIWGRLSKAQAWAVGVLVGIMIGLPLLGWWLWPVQWTDASFNELAPAEAALVLNTLADYYAYSEDPVRVAAVLHDWRDGESLICAMAATEDDFWTRARLISIAAVRNGRGCE